jgi:hypothetical protein
MLCTNGKIKILHGLPVSQQEWKGVCRWNIIHLPSRAAPDYLHTANHIRCLNTQTFIYTNKIIVERLIRTANTRVHRRKL